MAKTALALALTLAALPAMAGEATPDYSKDAIFRFAHDFVQKEELEKKTFDFAELGQVKVQVSPGVRLLLKYLPFLAPLPGTRLKDVAILPDPFLLTGTDYAAHVPPRMSDREYERVKDIGDP
jgi:hypothetical protein